MTNSVEMKKSVKKKKIASLDKRKARAGWIFVLPFIIGFLLIYLPMIVESLQFSFSEIKIQPGGVTVIDVYLAE